MDNFCRILQGWQYLRHTLNLNLTLTPDPCDPAKLPASNLLGSNKPANLSHFSGLTQQIVIKALSNKPLKWWTSSGADPIIEPVGTTNKPTKRGNKVNSYKVTLEVKDLQEQYGDAFTLENYLVDVVRPALDALGLQLTFSQATKKRG